MSEPLPSPEHALSTAPTTNDLPSLEGRLLVVDDDEEDASLIASLLERAHLPDLQVEWASSAASGLARLSAERFDACLVDYRMGATSGLSLIEAAGELPYELAIILLTGSGSRDVDLAAMRAGASDYLSKESLSSETLEKSIRYAIEDVRRRVSLERLARRDPLTGLYNRASIEARIEQAAALARRDGTIVAVGLLDLDGFKAVNDQLGHSAGDELLQIVAKRLRAGTRAHDLVGRLGGDEFVIVLQDLEREEEAVHIAERLVASIRPPFGGSGDAAVSASLGLATFPAGVSDHDDLLRAADEAMYVAKRAGKARVEVYGDRAPATRADLESTASLFGAIARRELRVVFQPQLELRTRKVVGVEALVRWYRPGGPILAPDEFLPALERSGAISELDLWVLQQAVDWQRSLPSDRSLRVSVNVSPASLARSDFVSRVEELLPSDPSRLEIEVSESHLFPHRPAILDNLRRLRELGLRIALDQFGTGPSSLVRLRDLPIVTLKIHHTFVHRMPDDDQDAAVVESLVAFSERLGIGVVASGVESQEQAACLDEVGVRMAQGTWFAPPLPNRDLMRWLETAASETKN